VRNGPIHVEWFKGGLTNIAYNCLDRHVAAGRGDQPCFLWEGNEPKDSAVMTYSQVGWGVVGGGGGGWDRMGMPHFHCVVGIGCCCCGGEGSEDEES
jgi:hypothetical protein